MAMSVKAAKEHCGYQAKPVLPTCGNCGAFASDFEVPDWAKKPGEEYICKKFESGEYAKVEKNLRCTDHGFATKKMASCKLWRPK
jgi:hypothetical protein